MAILDLFRRRNLKRSSSTHTASSHESEFVSQTLLEVMRNPDAIVRGRGLKIYQDMIDSDPQVKSGIRFKQLSVIASGWEIQEASDEPVDKEIAEFITWNFENILGNINGKCREILDGLIFGYSVHEKIWKRLVEGDFSGMVALADLADKPASTFDFAPEEDGSLGNDGLIQFRRNSAMKRTLDPNKFLIWSYQKRAANWYGRSDLTPAFPFWFSKRVAEIGWNLYLEKHGNPVVVGEVADTVGDKERDDFFEHLKAFKHKQVVVVTKDKKDVRYLEPKTSGNSHERKQLYNDIQIARALLMPDLMMSQGQRSGSLALGKSHGKNFLNVTNELGIDIEDRWNEDVICPLVLFNFDREVFPKFKFKPRSPELKTELMSMFSNAIDSGVLSESEEFIRDWMGFPETEEDQIDNSTQLEGEMEGETIDG